ncbi:MAG: hypothetical protein EZS26_001579 [Candidatus Ordinivivax streblomastigis]|uniref:BIG2 domain-containing protein n=1 Tax=Candidatus Ordinivivax streblomastigis TaxID=2540710 RepID=A0A5M8P1B0_9BACT|nr:MAG: hypothetical protein EZS26_001579 [Candidatus Ordinivivax streblomastigis]
MKQLIGIILLGIIFISCNKIDEPVATKLEINKAELILRTGEKEKLQIVSVPATNEPAEWTSSDETVATVFIGEVTAEAVGTTTITVTMGKYSAQCVVIVPEKEVGSVQARSKKRGVSYNFTNRNDVQALGTAISWSYNWGTEHSAALEDVFTEYDLDYCPMAWNNIDANRLRAYKAAHPKCQYLLAFNEPNLKDQANMTPAQVAEKWPALQSIAQELNLKIISPAMNYGTLENYGDPVKWLDEFFSLVPLSGIDGISIHCYMANAGATKSYIDRFKKYNKPIWLTEFCAWDGVNANNFKLEGQMKYMSDIINYMESDPAVFRYAWFIPKGDNRVEDFPYQYLLTKTSPSALTPLGQIFTQISSQDKNLWYNEGLLIEAEHYSSICIAEGVNDGWVDGPAVRLTSDGAGQSLELYNFFAEQWVEYQVDIRSAEDLQLVFRYATFIDTDVEIYFDNALNTTYTFTSTGQDFIWNTASAKIHPTPGKHVLRLKVIKGALCLNWLQTKIKK